MEYNTWLSTTSILPHEYHIIDNYFPSLFILGIYVKGLYKYDMALLIENAFESSLYGKVKAVDLVAVHEERYNAIITFYHWNASDTRDIRYNLYMFNHVKLYYAPDKYWEVHDYSTYYLFDFHRENLPVTQPVSPAQTVQEEGNSMGVYVPMDDIGSFVLDEGSLGTYNETDDFLEEREVEDGFLGWDDDTSTTSTVILRYVDIANIME